MPIEVSKVQPFFQVVIFEVPKSFKLPPLIATFVPGIIDQNSSWNEFVEKKQLLSSKNPLAWHFEHFFAPSWYDPKSTEKPQRREIVNKEHDLLFLYQKKKYLFVHTQCGALLSRAVKIIKSHKVGTDSIKEVRATTIKRIVDNTSVKFSSVGIENLINQGGTAPEAKSYHGRDADACLTPSFDSGFAVSYFMGRDEGKKSSPMGCSVRKRKVWRTWVEKLSDFEDECDEIIKIFDQAEREPRLNILSQPIEPFTVKQSDILGFAMDFTSEKGFAWMKFGDNEYREWSADLCEKTKKQISINMIDSSSSPKEFLYRYEFDGETNSFRFTAITDDQLKIQFSDDDVEAKSNPVTLTQYLNQNKGFTFLLSTGRIYKNLGFWRDNRFELAFTKTDSSFNWTSNSVNIEAETRTSSKLTGKEISIHEFLEKEILKLNPLLIINDDGSNEVADLLFVDKTRFVLVHAKYAGSDKPGLSAEDLQVVSTQAIKNLKYFVTEQYGPRLPKLFENYDKTQDRLKLSKTIKTKEELQDKIRDFLNDVNRVKECWIVQPGVSSSKLAAATTNKMHVLLNHVLSNCSANNVQLTLFCSP